MVNEKYVCEICERKFTPKNSSDRYCGILCLNASITNNEQISAILSSDDKGQINCPICGRNKKFLIHKRMNGQWYLWQEYHYNDNKDSIYTCYYCNLWEKEYRRRNKRNITPEEHRRLIKKDGTNDKTIV